MKNKTKFIWFYSVLLFSAALLLILISTLSQSRLSPSDAVTQLDEQQAFNQTIQRSVTDLIKENEDLRAELKTANEKVRQLESESDAIAMENKQTGQANEATEFVLEAEMLFNNGKYANSRDVLQNANALVLSDQGKQLYEWLKSKLLGKGFKLQG